MASYTPNVNLKKPADGDAYDIADANGNMDAIDTAIGSLRESVNHGTVAFGSIAAGSYEDKTVTFDTQMPGVPAVVAIRSNVGATAYDIQLGIRNESQSGFLMRCWNRSANAVSPTVAWIAVC